MTVEPGHRGVAAVERIRHRLRTVGHRFRKVVAGGSADVHLGCRFNEEHCRRKQPAPGRFVAAQVVAVESVGNPPVVEPLRGVRAVQIHLIFRTPPEVLVGLVVDHIGPEKLVPLRKSSVVVVEDSPVGIHVHLGAEIDLLHVAGALRLVGRPPRLVQRREQHRGEDCDDRNHDQELNQGEFMFLHHFLRSVDDDN